jgi:hypothetical protein
LVEQRVRHTNRLAAALKEYPQVLQWFEDKGTLVFCHFPQRWDTPEKAKKARPASVEAYFKEHNVRYAERIVERLEAMQQCAPLTEDPGVVLPAQQMVRALLPPVVSLIEAIKEYDAPIGQLEAKLSGHQSSAASRQLLTSLHRGGWRCLARTRSASEAPRRCIATAAAHPSPNAAASRTGSTGATECRRSGGRRS